MPDDIPILLWFRRDLRMADHPALSAACETGRPVIPVWLLDEVVESHGACPKWRLGLGVESFADRLTGMGSKLILRRGRALDCLRSLVRETGADAVWWTRLYDPDSVARDTRVKAVLKADGIDGRSFPGHTLFEPWEIETKGGGYYKVFTPFWKAVKARDIAPPLPAPRSLTVPQDWPASEVIADWTMSAPMDRGAEVVRRFLTLGEAAAQDRLAKFTGNRIENYTAARDIPGIDGTSGLSENLTYGEISVGACWHAGRRAMEEGKAGAETFLKELAWRDFAHHLVWHTPVIVSGNWRPEWDAFPWNEDTSRPEVMAWKQGRTGVDFVDAAMREMYVTGRMHNRARMIVASYLTKHLMAHWRIGRDWFADCLTDWDQASNAMGWQWSAGSGPDATPYFRVFNPDTQAVRFDPDRAYVNRWIAEGQAGPPPDALAWFDAIPLHWAMSPDDPRPAPVVGLTEGRRRALDAYQGRGF